MNIGFLFQMVGLVLDFFGALLLIITEIKTRKEIENESSTRWGENPYIRNSLIQKSKISILATVLLLIGFSFQLIGLALG